MRPLPLLAAPMTTTAPPRAALRVAR
eukprot:COSAG06_NODE_55017_length_291_cov_2.244792_1_plen_25_part_01